MKRFAFSTIIFFAGIQVAAAVKLPPLPVWNEEDKQLIKKGEMVVGLALLTKEGLAKKGAEEVTPEPAELIIEAVEEKPQLEGSESLAQDSVIEGEMLEKYFGAQPEAHLVDPQSLLSMQERADMQHALQVHSEESEVPIVVYLFDSAQKLGEEYSPKAVYDSIYAANEKPLVMVYYFLEAPQRSKFLLAGGAADGVPTWQVRELLWNAAHKAKEKSVAFDQLDDFVGQLSMRLFWIEEIIHELAEVEPVVVEKDEPKVKASKAENVLGFWENTVKYYLPLLLSIIGAVVALLLGGVFFVLRRRYHFPELTSSPRLGGKIGGSFGGVLSYRVAHIPPSEQKGQFNKDFF